MDHFFKDSFFYKFAEFWVFRTYIGFQTASAGVCLTSQVCVVTRDGPNDAEGMGRLSDLPVKNVVSF